MHAESRLGDRPAASDRRDRAVASGSDSGTRFHGGARAAARRLRPLLRDREPLADVSAAMADALTADLRGLGLDVDEDDSGAETGHAGNLLARIPGPEGAPHGPAVRAHGHRPARRARRGGERERPPDQPPRRDPGRRQQGRRRDDHGRGAPDRSRGQAGRRRRAPLHHRRGAGARGRQGVRQVAPRSDFGYVFDHASPIGEVVAGVADLLLARGSLQGRRPPTRASARRRATTRSRRRAAPSRPCGSAGLTRDHGERRPHRGRHGRERGGGALLREVRDPQPRRRPRRRGGERDGRRARRGGQRLRVRRGDLGRAALPGLPAAPHRAGRWRWPRRRCATADRAGLHQHRRRQRRERLHRRPACRCEPRQRHRAQPPAGRVGDGRGAGDDARRDGRARGPSAGA